MIEKIGRWLDITARSQTHCHGQKSSWFHRMGGTWAGGYRGRNECECSRFFAHQAYNYSTIVDSRILLEDTPLVEEKVILPFALSCPQGRLSPPLISFTATLK